MLLGAEMLQVVAICQKQKAMLEKRPNDQTLVDKQKYATFVAWCFKVRKHFLLDVRKKCRTSNVVGRGQTVKHFA